MENDIKKWQINLTNYEKILRDLNLSNQSFMADFKQDL